MKFLASSTTYSADILENIDNVADNKEIATISDIYPAGSAITDDRCPFCNYDLKQVFYLPGGKCPNCHRNIWYNPK